MFKEFTNLSTGEPFAINTAHVLETFAMNDNGKTYTVIFATNGEKWYVEGDYRSVVAALNSNS